MSPTRCPRSPRRCSHRSSSAHTGPEARTIPSPPAIYPLTTGNQRSASGVFTSHLVRTTGRNATSNAEFVSYYLLKCSSKHDFRRRSKPRQGGSAGVRARIASAWGTFFAFFQKNFISSNPYPEKISEIGEKKVPQKLEKVVDTWKSSC